VSIGGRLLSALFRGNGIHHADSCTSRHWFLGPVSGTTSLIDAYTSPAGETTYTCTECRRLAIWKAGELQPDPIYELEHARARGPGEKDRAKATVELERLQRRNAEVAKRSGPVEPRESRGPRTADVKRLNRESDVGERPKESAPSGESAPQRRRRGRPPWTRERFHDHYRAALAITVPPHTDDRVAPHFEALAGHTGIEIRHLQRLIEKWGLPEANKSPE
jgi:hypothetical protein